MSDKSVAEQLADYALAVVTDDAKAAASAAEDAKTLWGNLPATDRTMMLLAAGQLEAERDAALKRAMTGRRQ